MISYVLPTRNRATLLQRTLGRLGELDAEAHERIGGAEIIVVDNASIPPVCVPPALHNGFDIRLISLETNLAAAARNLAAEQADGDWIVMLDDDSYPIDSLLIDVLIETNDDVAVIGADIRLPDGRREAGGLPEVFVGCGAAIRRDAFRQVRGYDPAFHYYVEEYDLSAKLILAGYRIVHDYRFRVVHEKADDGRDMNVILQRLVRNNGWVAQRYAPDEKLMSLQRDMLDRYSRIAVKERAVTGYIQGLADLFSTIDKQPRSPMPGDLFDRFTGADAVRRDLSTAPAIVAGARVAIVDEGKGAQIVRNALAEFGAELVECPEAADCVVIGSLSPGPMLDSFERRVLSGVEVVMPWSPEHGGSAAPASAFMAGS